MNPHAIALLKWLRADVTSFDRGYTRGYINAIRSQLEPWEYQYLRVIADNITKGISA